MLESLKRWLVFSFYGDAMVLRLAVINARRNRLEGTDGEKNPVFLCKVTADSVDHLIVTDKEHNILDHLAIGSWEEERILKHVRILPDKIIFMQKYVFNRSEFSTWLFETPDQLSELSWMFLADDWSAFKKLAGESLPQICVNQSEFKKRYPEIEVFYS